MINQLNELNKPLNLYPITDKKFSEFGRILDFKYFYEFKKFLDNKTMIPESGNIYIANDEELDAELYNKTIYDKVFGESSIQYGYCNGQNTKLNALEYHKSSEINIATTPLVLLLGIPDNIENGHFNSNDVVAFYLPENTAIELHPRILHFAPCKVKEDGFKCGVILPLGTNTEFIKNKNITCLEDEYLFKTNKWLLAHSENERILSQGAKIGIIGENLQIRY